MNRSVRSWAAVLGLAVAYVVAGKVGLSLAFLNASATAFWPPTGIALACVLLGGYRLWPGVFIGAFAVNITTQGNAWTSLAIATGNTLEAVVGAWLVNRSAAGPGALEKVPTLFRFILAASILTPLLSATIGVTSLCLGGFGNWDQYGRVWLTWWLGDGVSSLTIAPLLLLWKRGPRLAREPRRWLEAGALVLAIGLVGKAVFLTRIEAFGGSKNPLGYLSLIPLLWAAFRFGQRGAATATLAMCAMALWGTLQRVGPFVTPDMNLSLLLLQSFIGTIAVTVLVLAAIVADGRQAEASLRAENVQRRQAEEARRQSEERFRLAASSDDFTLYEQDAELRYTWLYPLHPEHTGALGRTDEEIVPGEEGHFLAQCKREVMSTGISQQREVRATLPAGVRHYAMSICPRRDAAGAVVGVAGAALDITERVRAEQELQEAQGRLAKVNQELEARVQERTASLGAALSQMEEFSYTISHDLRAPLRAMQAYSDAILEDHASALPADARGYLERIASNAERLDKMILDVLTFSRIARADVVLEPVSLNRLVPELIRHYPAMQSPGARIEVEPLLDVLGHEPSLVQVLSNLLGNAVKFVPPGVQPQVRVWTERRNGQVRLWVEDNGIGVAPQYQSRLFSMFERIHPELKYEGNGVGLGIVKKAVERMGGQVGMESDGVNGCRFWIEIRAA